jgi:sigma-B regulation protein RsbU (phosphoserine phosphatase)
MPHRQTARASRKRTRLDSRAILAEFADLASEGSLSVEKLLPAFARLVRKIVDYELFAVLLRVRGSADLEVSFATGHGARLLRSRRVRIGRGITGAAAAARRIIVANDVRRDARYIPAVEGVLAEMAVPLIAQNRLIGVMDFEARRADVFGSEERSLLRVIAARVAMVLDGARMHQETVTWNRTLRTLLQVSHEFSTVLNLKQLLEQVAELVRHLIRYDALGIFLLDAEAGMLRRYLSVGRKDPAGVGDVPAGEGIVGAAARSAAPVLVADVRRDPRYLPAYAGIQSELAVPLVVRDKVAGVLNLESGKRGFFKPEHVRTLALLAPHLAASIENARLYEEVARHEARLSADLAAARDLQQSLLSAVPEFPGIEVSACNIPAAAVSGDFYDFLAYGRELFRIFIGDVSGKGAAAALFAAMASGAVHHLSSPAGTPASLLRAVNQSLAARNAARRYVAATVVDWRSESNCVVVSNAGAGELIVVREGSVETLRIEGLPLGLFATAEYEETSLPAGPGDMVVLASDGILECCDRSGCEYGMERLKEAILAHRSAGARELTEKILESVRRHSAGAVPQDDQTLIVLKIQPR